MSSFKLKLGTGIAILLVVFLASQGIYWRNISLLHGYTLKIISITEQLHTAEAFHSSIHKMLILASQYVEKQDDNIKREYESLSKNAESSLQTLKIQTDGIESMNEYEKSPAMALVDDTMSVFMTYQQLLDDVFINHENRHSSLIAARRLFDDIFANHYLRLHSYHDMQIADMQKNAHDIKIRTDKYFIGQLSIALLIGIFVLYYFDRGVLKIFAATEQLSIKDALTSLYNRRYLTNYLDAETARSARYNHSFSLAMIDIDNFKKINDSYGHHVGDELLRDLSSLIQKCVRKTDTVVRYGGEEFLVVFLETDKSSAVAVAEKIRSSIKTYPFLFDNKRFAVSATVSIGIASFPRDGQTWGEVIKHADNMLYKAKNEGKDRVMVG